MLTQLQNEIPAPKTSAPPTPEESGRDVLFMKDIELGILARGITPKQAQQVREKRVHAISRVRKLLQEFVLQLALEKNKNDNNNNDDKSETKQKEEQEKDLDNNKNNKHNNNDVRNNKNTLTNTLNCWSDIRPFGSVAINAELVDSDVDLACLVQADRGCSKEVFFQKFPLELKNKLHAKDIVVVKAAKVPVIRCVLPDEFSVTLCSNNNNSSSSSLLVQQQQHSSSNTKKTHHNVKIPTELDMIFAELKLDRPPTEDEILNSPLILAASKPEYRFSVNGIRTALMIPRLNPSTIPQSFQIVATSIKNWALLRGVLGNNFTFPGGVGWAVMILRLLQIYPSQCCSVIFLRFFGFYDLLLGAAISKLENAHFPCLTNNSNKKDSGGSSVSSSASSGTAAAAASSSSSSTTATATSTSSSNSSNNPAIVTPTTTNPSSSTSSSSTAKVVIKVTKSLTLHPEIQRVEGMPPTWDPDSFAARSDIFPVLNPAFPHLNTTHTLCYSTALALKREFSHAAQIIKQEQQQQQQTSNKNNNETSSSPSSSQQKPWTKLFSSSYCIWNEYRNILVIEIPFKDDPRLSQERNDTSFLEYIRYVESKFKLLLYSLDSSGVVECRPVCDVLRGEDLFHNNNNANDEQVLRPRVDSISSHRRRFLLLGVKPAANYVEIRLSQGISPFWKGDSSCSNQNQNSNKNKGGGHHHHHHQNNQQQQQQYINFDDAEEVERARSAFKRQETNQTYELILQEIKDSLMEWFYLISPDFCLRDIDNSGNSNATNNDDNNVWTNQNQNQNVSSRSETNFVVTKEMLQPEISFVQVPIKFIKNYNFNDSSSEKTFENQQQNIPEIQVNCSYIHQNHDARMLRELLKISITGIGMTDNGGCRPRE